MTVSVPKKRILYPCRRSTRPYTADGYRAQTVKPPLGRKVFYTAAVLCGLLVLLAIMSDIRTDTAVAEWWTRHVQAGWEHIIGTLTSWLPFSVFEFLLVCAIGAGVFLLYRLFVNLCRGRFKKIGFGVLITALCAVWVLDLYIVTMGFAYYRAPMPIPQSERKYDSDMTGAVVDYFLEDYNRLSETLPRDGNGCVICPYSFSRLAELMRTEYRRLGGGYYHSYTPKAKPVVFSRFMSYMQITGITFLPTGEANINNAVPPTVKTVTMAHELAHAKGIFREGDANLLARYILLTSDNDYLRYCGYYAAFDNLMAAIIMTDDYETYTEYRKKISALTETEREYVYDYWASQPDIIGNIAEFFNDIYLKLNGAQNGTGSYGDGNKSDIIIPIDPDTGEPEKDPDTGEIIKVIEFSQVQKMFFAIYENKVGTK